MNIHITGDGNINKYYIQTLCLLYFPGEGFKENENGRWCRISTEKSNKRASAFVEIGDERDGISFSGHGEIELSSLVYGDLDKCEKLAAGLAFLEAAGK